ncbi:MAG: hypothetical protein KDM81_07315 [Verrucomicrobiae bacterium]|nr:hypothetical protein [Verrucomicrobiae bacterium]MCP5520743.1 hypothetical protein [Verrucomicrobiales bacterium]
MPAPNFHVPFSIPKAYGGFADCSGILKGSQEGLALEFQSQDGLVGIFRSGVRNKVLFWEELQALDYRAGWFRTWLVISTASLKSLEGVPGVQNARLHLKVSRNDRPHARELATFASLRLCERDLKEMQSRLETG